MTMPFTLPPWLPWWVPILVLVPAILYALVFLLMPFSVLGLKGRLDVIEARLDEVQHEIRTLSLRLGEPARSYRPDEDAYDTNPLPRPQAAAPRAVGRRCRRHRTPTAMTTSLMRDPTQSRARSGPSGMSQGPPGPNRVSIADAQPPPSQEARLCASVRSR